MMAISSIITSIDSTDLIVLIPSGSFVVKMIGSRVRDTLRQ
jgi:hypothetical protein